MPISLENGRGGEPEARAAERRRSGALNRSRVVHYHIDTSSKAKVKYELKGGTPKYIAPELSIKKYSRPAMKSMADQNTAYADHL